MSNSYSSCTEFLQNNQESNNKINEYLDTNDPNVYLNKLTTLQDQLPGILEDFKKSYVFYHKNPEIPEYQQMYASAQNNLFNTGSQLYDILINIEGDSDGLNNKMICLNKAIIEEKTKNTEIKKKLGIVEEQNNATSELIFDYKNIYEEGYLRNWALFLSIIISFVAVKYMYSSMDGDLISNIKNSPQNVRQNIGNLGQNVGNIYQNMKDKVYKYNQR